MALDPEIALGVKSYAPPPISLQDYALNGMKMAQGAQAIKASQQEVLASQQAIEASKAVQASTEADTKVKQRAIDFNNWQSNNTNKFINADGTPNINGFINGASKDGFFKEAQAAAAADLTNKGQAAINATSDQDRAIKAATFVQDNINHAATLLAAAPKDQRAALLKQYADFGEKQVPGTGEQLMKALGVTNDQTGIILPDDAKIEATRTATMTAEKQKQLELEAKNAETSRMNAATSAEATRQGGAQTWTSPAAMDANSPLSRDEAQKAKDAGVPGVEVGKTSAYQIHGSPTTAPQVAATTVPVSTKSQQLLTATEEKNAGDKYGQAVGYVDNLNIPKGTKVQSWLNNNASNYGNNPNYQALQSMLQQYKLENPGVDLSTLDADALRAGLKAQQMVHYRNATSAKKNVQATTFNKTGEQPAGAGPVQVKSKEERDALPPGTSYIGPDGETRVKK